MTAVLARIAILAGVLAGVAGAQAVNEQLKARIADLRYSQIALASGIFGDVKLRISDREPAVSAGHPMLAVVAARAALAIEPAFEQAQIDVAFHFVLIEPMAMQTVETLPRGDAVERFFLRILGRKAVKKKTVDRCEERYAPPNKVKVRDGGVEIWVFGSAACPMVNDIARR